MNKVTRPRMTEKEFNNIKLLQKAGLTRKQMAELSKRSIATTNIIAKSETFEEYTKKQRSYYHKSTTYNSIVKPEQTNELDMSQETGDIETHDIVMILENLYNRLETIEVDIRWILEHAEVKTSSRWFTKKNV